MIADTITAIRTLNPTVVTTIDGVAYDKDMNQVEYDLEAVTAWVESRSYIMKRLAEYPPITDYLDGVVKGDQAQIDAYIAACQAVKAKYPKV